MMKSKFFFVSVFLLVSLLALGFYLLGWFGFDPDGNLVLSAIFPSAVRFKLAALLLIVPLYLLWNYIIKKKVV